MEFYQKNKQLWNQLLIGLGCGIGAYLFFQYVFVFIAPFVVGWLLSLLFHPLVTFLERKYRLPRSFGTMTALFLLLLFFAVVVMGAWHKLYTEAQLFYENMPAYLDMLQSSIHRFSLKWDAIIELLPDNMQAAFGDFAALLASLLPSLFQGSGSASFGILKAIPNGFMGLIIAFISSYFFTKDKIQIDALAARHAPALFGDKVVRAKKDLKQAVIGYVKTQMILMFYTFGICIVGLVLLGSPYAFLLSVITSIIDAIPFFGSGFILWPGALIFFLTGSPGMAIGYLAIYLAVNLMRQVMQPKILGDQIGLHPLLTLIAMYVGLKCLGFLGMILGPVVAVFIQALFNVGERELHLKNADKQKQT